MTARDLYEARRKEIMAMMKEIPQLLKRHEENFNGARGLQGKNYGFAGDLARVAELLGQTKQALGGE